MKRVLGWDGEEGFPRVRNKGTNINWSKDGWEEIKDMNQWTFRALSSSYVYHYF